MTQFKKTNLYEIVFIKIIFNFETGRWKKLIQLLIWLAAHEYNSLAAFEPASIAFTAAIFTSFKSILPLKKRETITD